MAEQKQKMEKLNLDRQFIYQGQIYGPGEVDVPSEIVVGKEADGSPVKLFPADDIRASMERAKAVDVAAGRKSNPDLNMVKPQAIGTDHPAGIQQVPHPQQPVRPGAVAPAAVPPETPPAGSPQGQQPPPPQPNAKK